MYGKAGTFELYYNTKIYIFDKLVFQKVRKSQLQSGNDEGIIGAGELHTILVHPNQLD